MTPHAEERPDLLTVKPATGRTLPPWAGLLLRRYLPIGVGLALWGAASLAVRASGPALPGPSLMGPSASDPVKAPKGTPPVGPNSPESRALALSMACGQGESLALCDSALRVLSAALAAGQIVDSGAFYWARGLAQANRFYLEENRLIEPARAKIPAAHYTLEGGYRYIGDENARYLKGLAREAHATLTHLRQHHPPRGNRQLRPMIDELEDRLERIGQ